MLRSGVAEMATDWDESAEAWIAEQGDAGDFSRQHVLDPAILPILRAGNFERALDVGCGEGRFCRVLRAEGIEPVGLDPTKALLEQARRRDPGGRYVRASAEAMPFDDADFDLVISYIALVDIPDFRTAIAEMARVLQPGGTIIMANITDLRTAMMEQGWVRAEGRKLHYPLDRYMEERATTVAWSGIKIQNWHRPLAAYMQAFLDQGLILRSFDNPPALGGPARSVESYTRVPWLVLMCWQKPET